MAGRLRYLVGALTVGLVIGATPAMEAAPAPEPEGNTFLVREVRIFDGVRVTGTGSVLVVGGRIAAAGRIAVPDGIPVYDGRGKTLLPGLIDGHRHTFPGAVPGADPAADRRDALRFGVTTGLDQFGDPALLADLKRERRSLARTDQQDVWSAGIGVTVPDGLPPEVLGEPFPRLESDADPDQFVADRVREGADHIKMLIDDGSLFGLDVPTLRPEQVRAVSTAAHRRGKQAVAHAFELEHATTAVTAGVDGLVHVVADTAVDDAFVQAAHEHGTFFTSTLATVDCGQGADDLLADPLVRPYLSASQLQALNIRFPCELTGYQTSIQNIGRLHSAGVPVIVGTDAGAIFVAHGASMLAELSDMVRAGFTPAEALTAATATPAREYHLGDRGRVRPGFRADLLLVNGDPTTDIDAVRDIAVIWKNGYPVDPTVR